MQTNQANNPPVAPLLRWVTGFEAAVVFVSGAGLFFLPAILTTWWPWEIAPFNARFMGAVYFTSLMSAGIMAWSGRWSPSRLVTPMIFIFTAIVLIVSVLNLTRFTNPLSTILWFILYIGIPINCAYHLWLYRHQPPAEATITPAWLSRILLGQTLAFGIYGGALFLLPTTFSAFWPWGIDEFHGRMYSVAFMTPALGSFLLLRRASILEFFTLGITQVVGGVFTIASVVIVDSSLHRVDWTQAGTWAWMLLFALFGGVGVVLIVQARRLAKIKA